MRKLFGMLLLIFMFASASNAADVVRKDIGGILEEQKNAARAKLQELSTRNIAQAEEKRILQDLDTWYRNSLPQILEKHYKEVEPVISKVSLDEDIGGLGV